MILKGIKSINNIQNKTSNQISFIVTEENITDPKEIANAFNCHYLPGEKVVFFHTLPAGEKVTFSRCLSCIVLYCVVLCCIELYCVVLCCIELY